MRTEKCILMGMGIVVAILIGFLVGRRCPMNDPGETPTPKVDTLFIRDTNSFTEPKKEPSPDVLIKEIPVPVYVADSSAIDSLLRNAPGCKGAVIHCNLSSSGCRGIILTQHLMPG